MTYDDRESADGEESSALANSWHRLRYIMNPETYVDEDSTVNELLWQLFLEQRASRYWLRALCALLVVVLAVVVILWITSV